VVAWHDHIDPLQKKDKAVKTWKSEGSRRGDEDQRKQDLGLPRPVFNARKGTVPPRRKGVTETIANTTIFLNDSQRSCSGEYESKIAATWW